VKQRRQVRRKARRRAPAIPPAAIAIGLGASVVGLVLFTRRRLAPPAVDENVARVPAQLPPMRPLPTAPLLSTGLVDASIPLSPPEGRAFTRPDVLASLGFRPRPREAQVLGSIFPPLPTFPTKSPDALPPPPEPPSPEIAVLTGEGALPVETREATRRALAALDGFYTNDWYPRVIGPSRPDIPRRLAPVSEFRSFADQALIVAGQLAARSASSASTEEALRAAFVDILATRSIPGFSRHHWGTEVDVVSTESGEWKPGARLAALVPFMRDEAPRFGLYNPYAVDLYPSPERAHYNPEPWHLSFAPIGEEMRQRWLAALASGPELEKLLDRAAFAIADRFRTASRGATLNLPTLRRVLGTLDLPSYVRNVAPAPSARAGEPRA
jgi:D-alanyl-D-alanine carboxypeptidase